MPNLTEYETKPVECWGKMKELRRAHFRHTWEAHDKGDIVIIGIVEMFQSLFSGFGDFANPSFGPYFTVLMRNPTELVRVLEKVEEVGYREDMCSAMRCHLGQTLLGMTTRNPLGGKVVPDFIFQFYLCHSATKMAQIQSEELGIPCFIIDTPHTATSNDIEYMVTQFHEAIEWMEKTTGKKFDDEKFFEGLRNEWQSMTLWPQISVLCKNTPSPMDGRMGHSLRLPLVTVRHKKEAVEYFKTLLDEMKDRVAKGIAARPYETVRLCGGAAPFHDPSAWRYPERFGAINVPADAAGLFSVWRVTEDGRFLPGPTLEERGWQLKNRDDALRALADLYMNCSRDGGRPQACFRSDWVKYLPMMMKDFHLEGAVLSQDRGCRGLAVGLGEQVLALKEAGIPHVIIESCQSDPRGWNRSLFEDRMDAFMESFGLRKLEESGPVREVAEDDIIHG